MKIPLIYIPRAIPGNAVSMMRENNFDVEVNPEDRLLIREELIKNVKGKGSVICQMADRIDREIMKAAANITAMIKGEKASDCLNPEIYGA